MRFLFSIAVAGLVALSGCETMAPKTTTTADAPADTVLGFIQNTEELSALAGAIEMAGLADALGSAGPITIIAPNNAAFEMAGDVPEDALIAILKGHVVPGEIGIDNLLETMGGGSEAFLATLDGDRVLARTAGNDLFFRAQNGSPAKALRSDNFVSGGVIHIVDRVLGVGPIEADRDVTSSAAATPTASAPAPAPPSDNPGMEACLGQGGSLVQWYDADGNSIDACRTSEGIEYDLKDYALYSG